MDDKPVAYVTFGQVARRFGCDPYTVWRWHAAGRGRDKIKLQAIKVGGRWKTRWKWVRQFMAALDPEATAPPLQTSAARRRQSDRAEKEAKACVKPWTRL